MMGPFSVLFVCLAFSKIVITSSASCGSTSLVANLNYAQTLSSPSYNAYGYYPASTTCKWTIKAPSYKLVQLMFTTFNTYGYPTCGLSTDDTLKIYDASWEYDMIGKYCGNYLPANVVSSGQNLYLVFESKSRFSSLKKGFKLEYKAVNNPTDDRSICSPFNSDYSNKNIRKVASTTTKYIKSPLYPNKYPSKIECVWYISASSSNKIKLTLKNVKIFNYKYYSSCSSSGDILTISDGSYTYSSKLKTICTSTYLSTTVTSSGSSMTIRFKSNVDNYFSGSTAGFQAEYIEIEKYSSTASTVGVVVGVVIGFIILIGLIVCCVCVAKKNGNQGYVQRTPAVTTMQTTTTTAPQYPMQPQGSCPPPPSGNYPPPVQVSYPPQGQTNYPPPGQANYPPPGQASYPPPGQASYPPPGQANYPPPGQASYPPPGQASYPPPGQASYPPPGQASYPPPGQGSYPPPGQGSNPPATQGSGYPQDKAAGGYPPPMQGSPYPVPSDPPPQYPGPPAYPPQQNQPYNPQATAQPNPPYPPT